MPGMRARKSRRTAEQEELGITSSMENIGLGSESSPQGQNQDQDQGSSMAQKPKSRWTAQAKTQWSAEALSQRYGAHFPPLPKAAGGGPLTPAILPPPSGRPRSVSQPPSPLVNKMEGDGRPSSAPPAPPVLQCSSPFPAVIKKQLCYNQIFFERNHFPFSIMLHYQIAFAKTHKTGGSTLQNILFRSKDGSWILTSPPIGLET